MKPPIRRIMLASALGCSILILGLELSLAGHKQGSRGTLDSAVTPETTFNDNVTINTGGNPTLRLNQNTSSGAPARAWDIVGSNDIFFVLDVTTSTFPFNIRAGAPTDSLLVAGNGNVGLGTNAPGDAIHIARSANPGIRLQQTSLAQTWTLFTNHNGFFIQDNTAAAFPFVVRSGTGNAGIGTTTPAGKLHVNGAGAQLSIFQSSNNDAVQFRLQTDSINRRFVALSTAGQQQSQLLFGDNGAFDFLGATAGDVRMRFLANGNVGIGTTAPDQKLTVNGDASKPGGGSWATFSDERLKDIKGEFKGGLDEVMKLQPIRYEYKADNAIGLQSEGEHIGFGAAAVSKVIPEAVTRSENGYLMINNDPILWTMLNAIKEQNAQMKEQSLEIAQLKQQLQRVQAQVALQAEGRDFPRQPAVAKANR